MTACEHEEQALFPFIVNKSFLTDGMIERLAGGSTKRVNSTLEAAAPKGGGFDPDPVGIPPAPDPYPKL